ncbi:hypothetical protein, partial [Escherichia fergusonii]|uniref:hypothetical protein n=1 Tax=Escherichia fergusonii TaxID=564 RepID=UPI0015D7A356
IFSGEFVVRADRRGGTMPKLPVLILDDSRECRVNTLAGCMVGDLVDSGPDKRVLEPHFDAIEVDQFGGD